MEAIKSTFNLKGVVDTKIGGRSENQDFYGCCDIPIGTAIVVCDGMGGMQGGQIASRVAVNVILKNLMQCTPEADPAAALSDAIKAANDEILKIGSGDINLKGMGTTVTALVLNRQCATVAYLGDSRIYQFRNGKKVFRTFDHSMVFELVKNGRMTEEEARRSDKSNVILQALGIFPEVNPSVYKLPYCKGDRFMLCTDGFWGAMPETQLIPLVANKQEPRLALRRTGELVNEIGVASGGHFDNLTAALIDVNCNSKMKEKMDKTAKIIISVLSVLLAASLAFNIIAMLKGNDKEPAHSEVILDNEIDGCASGAAAVKTDNTGDDKEKKDDYE